MSMYELFGKHCEENVPVMQPWPNYYKLRAKEMEFLFDSYSPKDTGLALDIGAGIGFNAALLGKRYNHVVATDLYRKDPRTHSTGLNIAWEFLTKVGVKNVVVTASRCEALPFKDNTFSSVYMFYTLEHIQDRKTAMKEVRRVLMSGGEAVIVVPCFFEKVFYPFLFYRDMLRSAVRGINKKFAKKNVNDESKGGQSVPISGKARRLLENYPNFPFPEPHGEYGSFASEVIKSTSIFWLDIAKKSGFAVKKTFTTMLFPKPMFDLLASGKSLDMYIKTSWLNKSLGDKQLLKHCGQNFCMVLEKIDVE